MISELLTYRKSLWIILVIFFMTQLSNGVIVFQKPIGFGTMQIQLTTTTGFIAVGTTNTFSIANPGYQNITSLGLALCGYDIPNPTTLQFRAEASYDNIANSIVILILPQNSTKIAFLNYFVIITTQQIQSFLYVQNTCLQPSYNPYNSSLMGYSFVYTISSPFVGNSTSTITGIPYIRSVNNIVASSYNFAQIMSIFSIPSTNQFNITLLNNYSYQFEVCLSIVCYWNSIGSKYNLLNVSYSSNFLIINSSSSTQNLASISQQNFTLNNVYGPIFNGKCLVGFQSFKMASNIRQTISFNFTGNGLYGIVSSSNNVNSYSWFCMAQITCQGTLAQYYPAINDCQNICLINNCTVCETSTSCTQCDTGFFINTLYRCSNCIANCKNCTNAYNCLLCTNGYYYNGTVCVPCAQFCTSCSPGVCIACQYGYYSSGAQCISCSSVLPNCLYCATGTYCSTCPQGYYSGGTNQGCLLCSQAQVGCSTCGSAIYCSTCMTGYYLNGNTCKACVFTVNSCCPTFISNCSMCKGISVCQACTMGYYLSNSNQSCTNCLLTLPYCLTCSSATVCTLCNNTYFLNAQNQCVSCANSISQCQLCTNAIYCTYCQLPFLMVNGSCLNCPIWPTNNLHYLDANNVCQLCSTITENCIICNQDQTCTQCSDLYFLSNNVCYLCSGSITNCLSCNSNTSCNICLPGYYPDIANSTKCVPCSSNVSHCTSCTEALVTTTRTYSVLCMTCENEYYLNSSECTSCLDSIPFCLVCSNNFQCIYCEQGYFLSSTRTCIQCIQLIIGCSSCQSSSVCLSCTSGYYLINNYCTQCKYAINNCHTCGQLNNTLTCSSCLSGYYLGANFVCNLCNSTIQFCSACISATVCIGCISGYVTNYNNTCSLCTYLIDNCQYCSQITCIKCLNNYILNNYGDCQSCDQFISGCFVCAYTVSNLTLQSQLNCTTCLTGYLQYLSGSIGKCIACNVSIPNCISCENLTFCNTCNNLSFVNSKNTCSLCSLYLPNCIYCNGSNICLVCTNTYYLNSQQTCEYCDPSQFGNDGTVLKLPLCLSCKYLSSIATCLNCIPGYFAYQNGCVSCAGKISNCISCATSTLCIQCASGFYLSSNNDQCINCPTALTYCSTCDLNGLCMECQSDCYLNSTLNECIKCYQITSGCNSCNNGTCLSCLDGYYMSALACLSCSNVLASCLLCHNASICLLYSSNATVTSTGGNFLTTISSDTWMYIFFACLGFIALSITLCIIWRKCRSKDEEELKSSHNATKSQTDRQLHLEQATESNDVKINHGQLCQHCKLRKFEVMNIELLCVACEAKVKDNKEHIIRKQITSRKASSKPKGSKRREGEKIDRNRTEEIQKSSKKSSNDEQQLVGSNYRQSDHVNEAKIVPKLKMTESQFLEKKVGQVSSSVNSKNPRKISKSHL